MRSRSAGLLVALAACGAPAAPPSIARVTISAAVVAETDPRFLSFSIDVAKIMAGTDLSRPRLRRMAAALAPAVLRIGGTEADLAFYDLGETPIATPPAPYQRLLHRADWDAACDFARDLGLEIMFTLDAGPGPRDAQGRWTPGQARALVEHSRARGCPVSVWELGNEVNAFPVTVGTRIDGQQYARDVAAARALLDEIDPGARLAGPASAYWPLWGEILPLLPDFLADGGGLIDVVTWHYYPQQSSHCPIASRRAGRETLLDPGNLDELAVWAGEVERQRALHAAGAALWLGESGHAQCGGEEELSDRYLTGFWWLDELGALARRGQGLVVRQALIGGRYHLVHDDTLAPAPDWFTSVLWKRLMGTRVLEASTDPATARALRIYAHCAPQASGAVTVAALNLSADRPIALAFDGVPGRRELYLLTSPDLQSAEIDLDGVALEAAPDGSPPDFRPRVVDGYVTLPPRTYAFVGLPGAGVPACAP